MVLRPLVLLVPSRAAAVELPRRLASTGRALAAICALKPLELARALAEPALLGRGSAGLGHTATTRCWRRGCSAARQGARAAAARRALRSRPSRAALARTLRSLHRAGVPPRAAAARSRSDPTSRPRTPGGLGALALHSTRASRRVLGAGGRPASRLYASGSRGAGRGALARRRPRSWSPTTSSSTPPRPRSWRRSPRRLPVRVLRRAAAGRAVRRSASAACSPRTASSEVDWSETPLAPLAPARAARQPAPAARVAVRAAGRARRSRTARSMLVTAPGEAAETRAIARRLLREAARGVAVRGDGRRAAAARHATRRCSRTC